MSADSGNISDRSSDDADEEEEPFNIIPEPPAAPFGFNYAIQPPQQPPSQQRPPPTVAPSGRPVLTARRRVVRPSEPPPPPPIQQHQQLQLQNPQQQQQIVRYIGRPPPLPPQGGAPELTRAQIINLMRANLADFRHRINYVQGGAATVGRFQRRYRTHRRMIRIIVLLNDFFLLAFD